MKALQGTLPGMIDAVQVAESGSFTAAARVLNLTPAAVSKNIAALEGRLQVRLFNRTTRQLSLTEEGRRFVAQAREGLRLLAEASTQAACGADPEGVVRISSGIGFGRRFVLPLLAEFLIRHPRVRVELNLSDSHVDLIREGFDLGIRGGAAPPEGMVARKIGTVSTLLAASPQYLSKHGTPTSWRDLVRHRIIEVRFQSRAIRPWQFREGGQVFTLESQGTLVLSEPATVVDAALHHLGIAQVSLHHAWDFLQSGTLCRVLARQHVPGKLDLAIYYPHRRGLASRVHVMVNFLLEKFALLPALSSYETRSSSARKAQRRR
jgi:DNA-binding transcriptional LysR family regulator